MAVPWEKLKFEAGNYVFGINITTTKRSKQMEIFAYLSTISSHKMCVFASISPLRQIPNIQYVFGSVSPLKQDLNLQLTLPSKARPKLTEPPRLRFPFKVQPKLISHLRLRFLFKVQLNLQNVFGRGISSEDGIEGDERGGDGRIGTEVVGQTDFRDCSFRVSVHIARFLRGAPSVGHEQNLAVLAKLQVHGFGTH